MSVKEDVMLNKAYEKLGEISNEDYLREIEELKLKAIRDEISIRNGEREEGEKKGLQKGVKKGKKYNTKRREKRKKRKKQRNSQKAIS